MVIINNLGLSVFVFMCVVSLYVYIVEKPGETAHGKHNRELKSFICFSFSIIASLFLLSIKG